MSRSKIYNCVRAFKSINQEFEKINFLAVLLYDLGIPGFMKSRRRLTTLMHIVSSVLFIASNVHIFLLFYGDFDGCHEIQCRKVICFNLCWRCFLLFIWPLFLMKRNQVCKLAVSMRYYENYSDVSKYSCFVNATAAGLLSFHVFQSVAIGFILWTDAATTDRLYARILFGADSDVGRFLKVTSFAVYYLCTELYGRILPLLLTLHYSAWSFIISKLIHNCEEQITPLLQATDKRLIVVSFINQYGGVRDLAARFESAMCLQVFWLKSCHFFVIFIDLARILNFRRFWPPIFIEKTVFPPLHAISFFAITYFASKVNQRDESLLQRCKNLAFRLRLSRTTEECGMFIESFILSKEALVFSASKMYNFKMSLLLISLGVIISYNLLILELNQPIKPY